MIIIKHSIIINIIRFVMFTFLLLYDRYVQIEYLLLQHPDVLLGACHFLESDLVFEYAIPDHSLVIEFELVDLFTLLVQDLVALLQLLVLDIDLGIDLGLLLPRQYLRPFALGHLLLDLRELLLLHLCLLLHPGDLLLQLLPQPPRNHVRELRNLALVSQGVYFPLQLPLPVQLHFVGFFLLLLHFQPDVVIFEDFLFESLETRHLVNFFLQRLNLLVFLSQLGELQLDVRLQSDALVIMIMEDLVGGE